MGERATIVGSDRQEIIQGTRRRDVIVGLGGSDQIAGLGGNDIICGGPHNDIVVGGPGADRIQGGGGDDAVAGGRGHDAVRGGNGTDIIVGAAGSDHLFGGRGVDVLTPGRGRDVVDGGFGEDTVSYVTASNGINADLVTGRSTGQGRDALRGIESFLGSPQRDVVRGTSGANFLAGLEGRDLLVGRGGNDRLAPGSGRDTLRGGPGRDLASYILERRGVQVDLTKEQRFFSIEGLQGSNSGDILRGTRRTDYITGASGFDRLYGNAGDDVIRGGGYGDRIYGARGSDRLFGGPDRDTITGGPGDDAVRGGPGLDTLMGSSGNDRFYGGSHGGTVDYRRAPNRVVVDLRAGSGRGWGTDRLSRIRGASGSRYDDQLYGDEESEWLSGHDGDDIVVGYGGGDSISGGNGNDHLEGNEGHDRVVGDDGDDRVKGHGGDDYLSGGLGTNFVDGGSGNDEILGGSGNETLIGDEGDDVFESGGGDDTVDGGTGIDLLDLPEIEGALVDLVAGTGSAGGSLLIAGIEDVYGTKYDDEIRGDDGANRILAGHGTDRLFGRGGDDHLAGNAGDDFADGAAGVDLCLEVADQVDCEILAPGPSPQVEVEGSPKPSPSPTPSFAPRDQTAADPAPTAPSSYTFQVDAARRGALPDLDLSPPLTELWTRDLGNKTLSPVIAEDKVFVVSRDLDAGVDTLHALSADNGMTLWSVTDDDELFVSYDAGTIFLSASDGRVQALDPATGAVRWDETIPHDSPVHAAPTVHDGDLYLAGDDTAVYALDAATGTFRWGYEYRGPTSGDIALSAGRIYVAYGPNNYRTFTRGDATHAWRLNFCCPAFATTPVYHEGRVYYHDDGRVVDAASGQERGWFSASSPPAVTGSIGVFSVYLGGGKSEIRADHLYGGGPLWSFREDEGVRGPPLIVGNQVFVTSSSKTVYALDLQSGDVTWSAPLPELPGVPGLAAGPGLLVVPTLGSVAAYGTR